MSHAGWFHRDLHGSRQLQWVPADAPGHPAAVSEMDTAAESSDRNGNGAEVAQVPPGRYVVSEVKGRRPTGVDDFLGVTSFTVIRGDLSYRVFGTGELRGGVVRFRQQGLGWDGRDIRTWTVSATSTGVVVDPDPTA
jgi:hypothetical protein